MSLKKIDFQLYQDISLKDTKFAKTILSENQDISDEKDLLNYFSQKIKESAEISNIDQSNIAKFIRILSGKRETIYLIYFFDFFKLAKICQINDLIKVIEKFCKQQHDTQEIIDIIHPMKKITAEEEPLFNEFIELGGMREKLCNDVETLFEHCTFTLYPVSAIFNILRRSKHPVPSSCTIQIYSLITKSLEESLHFLPFIDTSKLDDSQKDSLFKSIQEVEQKLKSRAEPKVENEENSNQFNCSKCEEMKSKIEKLETEKKELQTQILSMKTQQQRGIIEDKKKKVSDQDDANTAAQNSKTDEDSLNEKPIHSKHHKKDRNEEEEDSDQSSISKTYCGPTKKKFRDTSPKRDESSLYKTVSGGKAVMKTKMKKEEGKNKKKQATDESISKSKQKDKLPSANDYCLGDDYDYSYSSSSSKEKTKDRDLNRKKRRDEDKDRRSKKHYNQYDHDYTGMHDQKQHYRGTDYEDSGPKHITEKNKRRIAIFKENEKIFRKGKYQTGSLSNDIKDDYNSSIKYTELIMNHEKLNFKRKTQTELYYINPYQLYYKIEVTRESTFAAAIKAKLYSKKICVLNFASPTQPGGGVLNGRNAQEEVLSRQSSLYFSLEKQTTFYDYNKSHPNPFGTDYMIYSPNVLIIRDDNDVLTIPHKVSVISAVAVNNAEVEEKYGHGVKKMDVYNTMKKRCLRILEVCLSRGNDIIVLGAFGCGVFKNSPKMVSHIFKELLIDEKYACYFIKVIFAIKPKPKEGDEIVNAFKSQFTYKPSYSEYRYS